jgi:hypothetical protein
MIPLAINKEALTSPLAFITNQFAVIFNYVPLTVADCTNHFSLPASRTDDTIKRVASTGLAYTIFMSVWQEKNELVTYGYKSDGSDRI